MLGLSKPWVDELEFIHWRCVFVGLSVVFYNAYLPLLSEAHPDVSCGIDINNIMTLISFAYVLDLVMFERLAESYFCASVLSQVHAERLKVEGDDAKTVRRRVNDTRF